MFKLVDGILKLFVQYEAICNHNDAVEYNLVIFIVQVKSGYYIETPKTKSGYREIPMSEPVYQALKRVVKNRGKKTTIMIDGYTNFLFLKRDGTPKVGMDYNNMIRNLLKKYNKQHKEPLPNITPHSFRHTFCTRMANAGMNPKALQYIMGHANITMTLDYYTHVDACSVRAEMERLAA